MAVVDYPATPIRKRVNVAAGEDSGVLASRVNHHEVLPRKIGKDQVRPVEDRHVVSDVDDRTNPCTWDCVPFDLSDVLVFEEHQAFVSTVPDYIRIVGWCAVCVSA